MSRLSDVQPLSKTYLDLVGDRFSVYHIVAERDRCDISASAMSTISAPDCTILYIAQCQQLLELLDLLKLLNQGKLLELNLFWLASCSSCSTKENPARSRLI